ncbi:hypothetical protein AVEN_137849-1 [Araneus ventricosus]|uniref:Uncharacterized protein n=1 Tax=Araneus ventricosus TaxID=182803 RepID=A0A4Y2QFM2_ARAVE|nr:hypothetical protein AVEN_137849-1 [Araneus ventricosus]
MRIPSVLSAPNEIKPFPSPPKCSGISRSHDARHRYVWCLGFSIGGNTVRTITGGGTHACHHCTYVHQLEPAYLSDGFSSTYSWNPQKVKSTYTPYASALYYHPASFA